MKIRIVTNALYSGIPRYVELTDEIKQRYCDRWGFDYYRKEDNPHPELHPVWQKTSVMLDAIVGFDWCIWMDCDAAPVGLGFDIASYLCTLGDCVVMQRDINGWNAGVFAVSSGPRGIEWLEHIESLRNDRRYQYGYREQSAMSDSFAGVYSKLVVEPPREIGFNNYLPLYHRGGDPNLYSEGNWCLHLPAVSDDKRADIFSEHVNEKA